MAAKKNGKTKSGGSLDFLKSKSAPKPQKPKKVKPKPVDKNSPEYKKNKARELLGKSKFYRVMSFVFIFVGLAVFVYLYATNIAGREAEAIRSPASVLVLIIPFVPGAFLTWYVGALEKKVAEIMKGLPK